MDLKDGQKALKPYLSTRKRKADNILLSTRSSPRRIPLDSDGDEPYGSDHSDVSDESYDNSDDEDYIPSVSSLKENQTDSSKKSLQSDKTDQSDQYDSVALQPNQYDSVDETNTNVHDDYKKKDLPSTPLRFREAHHAKILEYVDDCLNDMLNKNDLDPLRFKHHHTPLFIPGLNATGKTESIHRVLNQFHDLNTVYINAHSCTAAQFFPTLFAKLQSFTKNSVTKKGVVVLKTKGVAKGKRNVTNATKASKADVPNMKKVSTAKALEHLFPMSFNSPILLVIDEIDALLTTTVKACSNTKSLKSSSPDQNILSILLRWLIHDPLKNQCLILIGISNYSQFPKSLSPNLQREFEGQVLTFESYSVPEVKSILQSYHFESPISKRLSIEDDVWDLMARRLNTFYDGDIRTSIDQWKDVCSTYSKEKVLTLDMFNAVFLGHTGWIALLKESRPLEILFWKAVILEYRNSQLIPSSSSILRSKHMKEVLNLNNTSADKSNKDNKTNKSNSGLKCSSKEVLCGRLESVHMTMRRKMKSSEYQLSLLELQSLLLPLQSSGALSLVYDIPFSPSLFIHVPMNCILDTFHE